MDALKFWLMRPLANFMFAVGFFLVGFLCLAAWVGFCLLRDWWRKR